MRTDMKHPQSKARAFRHTVAGLIVIGALACSGGGGGGGGMSGPPGPGASALSFTYTGKNFDSRGASWFYSTGAKDFMQAQATDSRGQSIVMQFPTPLSVPVSYAMDGPLQDGTLRLFEPDDGFIHNWFACDQSGSLLIDRADDERLEGSFHFEAVQNPPSGCGGLGEIRISGGVFDLGRDRAREP